MANAPEFPMVRHSHVVVLILVPTSFFLLGFLSLHSCVFLSIGCVFCQRCCVFFHDVRAALTLLFAQSYPFNVLTFHDNDRKVDSFFTLLPLSVASCLVLPSLFFRSWFTVTAVSVRLLFCGILVVAQSCCRCTFPPLFTLPVLRRRLQHVLLPEQCNVLLYFCGKRAREFRECAGIYFGILGGLHTFFFFFPGYTFFVVCSKPYSQ